MRVAVPLMKSQAKSGTRYKNTILQHLSDDSIERLDIRPLDLPVRFPMQTPGSRVERLFFIEAGVGSLTVSLRNGAQVEASMFGYESVVGVSALMGASRSLNNIFMQIGGSGYTTALETAQREFKRGEMFQNLALRYVQAQLTQSTQSTACNAKHEVEQRLARWLLICADRANTKEFTISQEFLASMLGTSRPTVTIAAGILKQEGLINYHRGRMHVLNMKRLEARACECYQVVKEHLDNLTEFDTGFVV